MSLAFATPRSRLGAVQPHHPRFVRGAALVAVAFAALWGCTDLLPVPTVAPAASVTVTASAAAICVGDSLAFTAQVLDDSGRPVVAPQLVWSSSAPQVVSVDSSRGIAHALTTGSTSITASSGGTRSAPVSLDVPGDLLPEFVPDSVVLGVGDTMTLGVRLLRASGGPLPSHTPVITPFSSRVASLDAAGLVTAKDTGRASLALSVCGQAGGGAADVFTPPDSVTGSSFLWLSGAAELRFRRPAQAINFTRTGGGPGFQIVAPPSDSMHFFLYEDTVSLAGPGTYLLDSLKSTEVSASLPCRPPRPFANYTDRTNLTQLTLLFGLRGDSLRVTTFTQRAGVTSVSGRMRFRVRGEVAGQVGPGGGPDTLAAIYTFSVPLVTVTGACP